MHGGDGPRRSLGCDSLIHVPLSWYLTETFTLTIDMRGWGGGRFDQSPRPSVSLAVAGRPIVRHFKAKEMAK